MVIFTVTKIHTKIERQTWHSPNLNTVNVRRAQIANLNDVNIKHSTVLQFWSITAVNDKEQQKLLYFLN